MINLLLLVLFTLEASAISLNMMRESMTQAATKLSDTKFRVGGRRRFRKNAFSRKLKTNRNQEFKPRVESNSRKAENFDINHRQNSRKFNERHGATYRNLALENNPAFKPRVEISAADSEPVYNFNADNQAKSNEHYKPNAAGLKDVSIENNPAFQPRVEVTSGDSDPVYIFNGDYNQRGQNSQTEALRNDMSDNDLASEPQLAVSTNPNSAIIMHDEYYRNLFAPSSIHNLKK